MVSSSLATGFACRRRRRRALRSACFDSGVSSHHFSPMQWSGAPPCVRAHSHAQPADAFP